MENSFKDFCNNFNSKNGTINEEDFKKAQVQAEDIIKKYQNKSNEELANELLVEVARQKANGTFSREQLLNMLDAVKPYLSGELNYNKIREIVLTL